MEGLFPCLLCAIPFIIVLLKLLLKHHQTRPKLNLPPSPPKLPIIGHLHQLGKMPHLSLSELANKLGPLMFLQLGEVPTVIVSSAAMAKEVMKTHDPAFSSRPQLYSAKWLFYDCTNIVFSTYGAYWRHIRKICIPRESINDVTIDGYDIPFGAGRRGCPGITFATVTVELALAQLLYSFDWELPQGVEAKDLDLSETFGISMHKASDLIVVTRPYFA